MSELLSEQLMKRLRENANQQVRPGERNGTLDRLAEACDDIASGKARGIVKEGLPDAEGNYRRALVPIKPPRVEEYVFSRRALDAKARKIPSKWTGPTATTIRKDPGLLEYVRVREQEQAALVPTRGGGSIDDALDRVDDLALRSELRFILARARQAEQDLLRLKEGMRKMRPTIDIESLIAGCGTGEKKTSHATVVTTLTKNGSDSMYAQAIVAVMKLTDANVLSKCGLEYSSQYGNIVERKTRFELITSDDLLALRKVTGIEGSL